MSEATIKRISESYGDQYSTIFTYNVEFRGSIMPVEVQFLDVAKKLLSEGMSEDDAVVIAIRDEVESVPGSEDWTTTISASPIELDVNRIRELGLAKDEA